MHPFIEMAGQNLIPFIEMVKVEMPAVYGNGRKL